MVHCMAPKSRYLEEYLKILPSSFHSQRKYYALYRVVSVFLDCSGYSDLDSLVDSLKESSSGLHVIVQKVIKHFEMHGKKNGEPLAPKTIRQYVSLLKNFLEFCDVDVEKSWRKIKQPKKVNRRVDRVPKRVEIVKLIMACKSPRIRLLIQLLTQTGLRLSEALNLKLADIDLENGWIRVRPENDKMGRGREVPIISELKQAIREYLEKRGVQSEYLFPSLKNPSRPARKEHVYETFYNLISKLDLDKRDPSNLGYEIHPHVFRKFFKTQLELANVNPRIIDRWMGHKDQVQDSYLLPSREMLKQEIAKAEEALSLFKSIERDEYLREKEHYFEEELKKIKEKLEHILKKTIQLRDITRELVSDDYAPMSIDFLQKIIQLIRKKPEQAAIILENVLEDFTSIEPENPIAYDLYMFKKYGEVWENFKKMERSRKS